MPKFAYKALASTGQIKAGTLSAVSRDALEMQLRTDGLVLLDLEERGSSSNLLAGIRLSLTRKPKIQDLILFTRELSTLLGAGLPIDRTLRLMSEQGNGQMNQIAEDLLSAISGGSSLSEALAQRPDIFQPFYVGMVRSGEAGGSISTSMDHLHQMLEKQKKMSSKVSSALTYPIIVLILTALSMVVLLGMVIPQFKPLFERSLDDIPTSTRLLLGASDFMLEYGFLAAGFLLVLMLALSRAHVSRSWKIRRDKFLLVLPHIGELVRALEVGRFCRVLGMLRLNGLTMDEAMPVAGGTIQNAAIASAVDHAQGPLSRGEGLSAPLASLQVFPPLAVEMIAVGEESGKLDSMLIEAADMLDHDADRKIQSALSLLMPIITVALGIIVASAIGSILSAILGTYELAL